MLNLEGTKAYWAEQTKNGHNPCHYHNKWQDAYAFRVRTRAFHSHDFKDVQNIVDVGCGVGDYTNEISKFTNAHIMGFDFPFNIKLARKKYGDNHQITFISKSLPDKEVMDAIRHSDIIITTTVYVHLSREAKKIFFDSLALMNTGSKVILLEYAPDEVPDFQKVLSYKEIETPQEIRQKFEQISFQLEESRPVNFVDSFFFHHLGANIFTYYLTIFIEAILHIVKYNKSKYKLFIFKKLANM